MNSPAVVAALALLGRRMPWGFSLAVEDGDASAARLALAQALLQRADSLAAGAAELISRRLPLHRAFLATIPTEALDAHVAACRLVHAAAALGSEAIAPESADSAVEAIFVERLGDESWRLLRTRVRQVTQ